MSEWAGKTAFVTGATGFLGGALVRRLSDEGVSVRALARRTGRDAYIKDCPGVEIVMGDLADAARMRELVRGADLVFHVAAAFDGPLAQQRNINVSATRQLAEAAGQAGVGRFVHVSSVATYGMRYAGAVPEYVPQQPGRVPYNRSKYEGEWAVIEAARRYEMPYTIQRPAMIYGPRSGAWTDLLFDWAKRPPVVFVGDGSGTTHPIYVDDVVDMLLVLATHPAAAGEVFNCAPDPAPTWREFLGGYARLAGHDDWLALPVPLVRIAAPLIETFFIARRQPQDLPGLVGFVTGQQVYAMDKARRLLDWSPQVTLDQGMRRCEIYLREKGRL